MNPRRAPRVLANKSNGGCRSGVPQRSGRREPGLAAPGAGLTIRRPGTRRGA